MAFDVEDLALVADALDVNVAELLPKPATRNTVWKTSTPLGERVVATVGEARKPRPQAHRPGRAVSQTRPIGPKTRPVTALAIGR